MAGEPPPQSYAWIIALDRSKNENLLRLSKVTLLERDQPRWGEIIPRDVRNVDLIERRKSGIVWVYPAKVKELFANARVELKVVVRKSDYRHRTDYPDERCGL
jgi:hypothetical protein